MPKLSSSRAPSAVISMRWVSGGSAEARLRVELSRMAAKGAARDRNLPQLELTLQVLAGTDRAQACVVVAGEIDIATIEPLQTSTRAVVAAARPRPDQPVTLLLDWRQVRFLDSSAVHFLQDITGEGVERGWTVQLLPPAGFGPARVLRFAATSGWLPRHLAAEL